MPEGNHLGVSYSYTPEVNADAGAIGINVEAEIKAAIENEVGMNKAVIYTKDNCPFCVRAKRLLSERGIAFTEMNAQTDRELLIQKVTEITGQPPRTVPQIWLNDHYVGGYNELEARLRIA